MTAPPGVTPVRAAASRRALARVKAFPDLPERTLDVSAPGDDRMAPLFEAIDRTIARSFLTLRTVIESRIDRAWDDVQPRARAALLVAAAQILYLDGIPDHAAVDQSVAWVRAAGLPRAAPFVNAVARSVARLQSESVEEFEGRAAPPLDRDMLPLPDGRILRFTENIFASHPTARLAEQTGHCLPLVERWIKDFGESQARAIAFHNIVQAPIIIPHGAGSSIGSRPHADPKFEVIDGAEALRALIAANPAVRIQDPASAAAVLMTAGRSFRRIIDYCAGRGTKTRQLMDLHPESEIIASDVQPARLDALAAIASTSGRVHVVPQSELSRYARSCDLLVLDVPCTNTGTIARRVEARYRFSESSLNDLVHRQRQIIADSLFLRAEEGMVLYSTCSLEREENASQAEWMEKWHPLRRLEDRLILPAGLPGEPTTHYHDGGYAALLSPNRMPRRANANRRG